ncbi:uncharacterized protein MEPE_01699 [Melanopsichium pennsylvanicum]|uniref:Uncharacterized protein n=1 Tax=Melanopsichium pennsylvanicum TaxID=63383 RepID=A0AAJ5C3Y3_9BASI|nr:uncharacterized protein MEPE_01699 [Melanopsichium pennsylvanicum]
MSSTSNTAPSAASSRPASTQMPALRAEEPVRRSARLRGRDPATQAVATLSAAGLEATTPSSPAAGEQPIEIVAAKQLVALRATPRPLEPLFLGNNATGEEEERLEAMEVEELVVGRISEVREDPVAPLVGPHVPNYLEIALWAESLMAPVLLVFVVCGAWPPAWVVSEGSVTAGRLHRLVLLRLTEGCMPWPSWQCARCAKLGVPCFPSAFADVLSAGGKGQTPRACVHCHLGGHKKCMRTKRALPTMVYAGDAPPSHLHRGERGVERAHVTGAGGRGLGEVRGLNRDSDGVADPNWAYAMRIIWSASPRGRRVPVLTTIEEYFDRQRQMRSMRSPFEDIEPPLVPGPSSAPKLAE